MGDRQAHRALLQPLTAYRIGDPDGSFPIWDSTGAAMNAGRWHRSGQHVIYAAEHYSTAMLEKLVHFSGTLPPNQHYLKITIPAGTRYEQLDAHSLSGWNARASSVARAFGSVWIERCTEAILIVPSVVAPMENNILINPRHPQFSTIRLSNEIRVHWDERLFD